MQRVCRQSRNGQSETSASTGEPTIKGQAGKCISDNNANKATPEPDGQRVVLGGVCGVYRNGQCSTQRVGCRNPNRQSMGSYTDDQRATLKCANCLRLMLAH